MEFFTTSNRASGTCERSNSPPEHEDQPRASYEFIHSGTERHYIEILSTDKAIRVSVYLCSKLEAYDMNEILEHIHAAILAGDAGKSRELTDQALAAGVDPLSIVQEAMTPAMKEAGRRFECHDCFVPELLMAARAMKSALEPIRPLLAKRGTVTSAGKVIIGTVRGDLHDIGKNLVAGMLEGAGYEVIDLGVNVTPQQFVDAARAQQAHIVAMSALLTTTMPAMKTVIDAIEQAGLRRQVKILIGGAPTSEEYAKEIGADGYSDSASGAVSAARGVMSLS